MTHRFQELTPPPDTFAHAVLRAAAEVEAAEEAIKRALLDRADDADAVRGIVADWTDRPPVEVAQRLARSGAAPSPEPRP